MIWSSNLTSGVFARRSMKDPFADRWNSKPKSCLEAITNKGACRQPFLRFSCIINLQSTCHIPRRSLFSCMGLNLFTLLVFSADRPVPATDETDVQILEKCNPCLYSGQHGKTSPAASVSF